MLPPRFAGPGAIALGLLLAWPVCARYVPDTAVASDGAIDISIRGDVALAPGALYPSVGGNEFVTVARREDVLAVCAFGADATPQSGFGTNGCYRETLAANVPVLQLLVGRTGYWVLTGNPDHPTQFSLLRLTPSGQQDTGYGALGRRSFDLACDGSDVAPRCPEVRSSSAQQFVSNLPLVAETADGNLWLLAARKTAAGADEGVVFRLDQGRSITARANLYDALPASWIPGMQQGVSLPLGIVAHGDGALVEHRTNRGYAVVRVGANGAVDPGFGAAQPGGVIVAGDGALPFGFFPMPLVATDNTFLWGFTADFTGRTRYDRFGATLGGWSTPGRVIDTRMIAAPPSFSSAATALWIWDGTRIGRWQNGQWDPATFGGQGPFQPAPNQALLVLTRNEGALAMVNTASSSEPAQLTIVATQAAARAVIAPAVVQSNAVLGTATSGSGIDPNRMVRSAVQADGRTVWQKIAVDPLSTLPAVATGTLGLLPAGSTSALLVSDAGAGGQRWAVRTLQADFLKPVEFYADPIGGNGSPRRINMDAIRADMPAFIPVTPFSNPRILNVDIAADGSALALISYPHGTSSAYQYRLALADWNPNAVAGGDYVPHIRWMFDPGSRSAATVQRDAQGRLLLIDAAGSRLLRLGAQGTLDAGFGTAGSLDLAAAGFTPSESLTLVALADGGAWIGSPLHLAHVSASGQVLAQANLPPQAPAFNPSRAMLFNGLLAEPDGSVLVVSTPPRDFQVPTRTDRLLRYAPTGEPDTHYGLRGAETVAVAGISYDSTDLPLANRGIAAFTNGTIVVLRYDPVRSGPTGETVPMVEFYNTTLDHYFMTPEAAEIASIEAGAAGPGWSRTGQSFPAWVNVLDAPGDVQDICRFYGSAVPLARSPNGRTGPNSHFYTFAGAECDGVYRNDHAWKYEGPTVALVPLLADKTCAAGLQRVFRAYNNGYVASGGVWTRNDASHRYATSQAVIAEMVGRGWTNEGAVFCAPN